MSRLKLYGVRLSEEVGKQYEEMASQLGLTPAEYIRDVLTNNLHTISLKSEVNRIEEIVNSLDKNIKNSLEKFTHENRFNEKYYEDVGGVYMMLIGILMKLNMEKDDIRNMQNRGTTYAQNNYIGKTE
jgi:predicted DNA-binding protein